MLSVMLHGLSRDEGAQHQRMRKKRAKRLPKRTTLEADDPRRSCLDQLPGTTTNRLILHSMYVSPIVFRGTTIFSSEQHLMASVLSSILNPKSVLA